MVVILTPIVLMVVGIPGNIYIYIHIVTQSSKQTFKLLVLDLSEHVGIIYALKDIPSVPIKPI